MCSMVKVHRIVQKKWTNRVELMKKLVTVIVVHFLLNAPTKNALTFCGKSLMKSLKNSNIVVFCFPVLKGLS